MSITPRSMLRLDSSQSVCRDMSGQCFLVLSRLPRKCRTNSDLYWTTTQVFRLVWVCSAIIIYGLDSDSNRHSGWTQNTIGHGARSSSAVSYLAAPFIQRPNLHVLINAQVSKVLSASGSTHFSQVEFSQDMQGNFLPPSILES
jgi:hypothetical protein